MTKEAKNQLEIGRKGNLTKKGGGSITDVIRGEKFKSQLAMALPKHFETERFVRIALTAIRQNPKLKECNQESLLGSLMTASQLGLEPGGVLGQCYIIPYGKNAQFQLGYKGMLELLQRSGKLSNVRVHTVYENDDFEYELGLEIKLTHKPKMFNRGNIIGFYAVAELKDGSKQFELMSKEDVEEHEVKHRKKFKNQVWVDHFEAMAHKTVLKKLMKYLPVSVELIENISRDNKVYKVEENKLNEADIVEPEVLDLNEDTGEIIETSDDDVKEIFG